MKKNLNEENLYHFFFSIESGYVILFIYMYIYIYFIFLYMCVLYTGVSQTDVSSRYASSWTQTPVFL